MEADLLRADHRVRVWSPCSLVTQTSSFWKTSLLFGCPSHLHLMVPHTTRRVSRQTYIPPRWGTSTSRAHNVVGLLV